MIRTNNDQMVVFCYDDLKEMIRAEVSQFSVMLEAYIREREQIKNHDEKLLSIQDVADRYSVSKQTVNNWMKNGKITGFKKGKGRFFYMHELEEKLTDYRHFEKLKENGKIPPSTTYMQFFKHQR